MDKKKEEQDKEGSDLTTGTTVLCPWHNLPLQIQTENKEVIDHENGSKKTILTKYAVCNCRVEDNSHMGQRVWEQT